MLIELAAAAAVGAAIVVGYGALSGRGSPASRRAMVRASDLQRADSTDLERTAETVSQAELLRGEAYSSSNFLNAILSRFQWTTSRAARLEQANLPLRVGEYALFLMFLFGFAALVAYMFVGLLVGMGVGVVVVFLSEMFVSRKAKRRHAKFNQQLPTALGLMATSVESGFSMMDSLRTVAREMDAPLSTEFQRILDETRVGASLEDSLASLVERIRSQDMYIVARALQSNSRTGGNLAEILNGVAEMIREREELRGHVKSITAEQRMSAVVVGLLPFWILGFFWFTDRGFIAPLWQELVGHLMLAAAGGLELLAFFFIRRISTIKV